MLIVRAIIVILASILFPVFARARENARHSSYQSNLKQIGLGIVQYVQDYDEKFPNSRNNGDTATRPSQDVIQPYVKSVQLFKCPSNTVTGNVTNSAFSVPISYLANGGRYRGDWSTVAGQGKRPIPMISSGYETGPTTLAELEAVAETILVNETTNRVDPETWPSSPAAAAFQGHLGTTNFLFSDGHVKSMKATATFFPKNMWTTEDDGDTLPQAAKDNISAAQVAIN